MGALLHRGQPVAGLEPGLASLRLAQGRADEVAAIHPALVHATEDFEREVG
jgi:hypothetical protein